ncbi:MAG: Uma2 family endonuclease [Leptolyngbya sp. SIO4C1]|nr:Uma2 family endonuclease [Leptolyngbya sp. SIO4C1]
MTLSTDSRMTLEEYLNYEDGTDTRYELVDGILVDMGAESDLNVVIGSLLFSIFLPFVPYYCIRRGTEIAVSGSYANTRYPDLVILTEAGAEALVGQKCSLVTLDMPAPALVVEVVSSGDTDQRSHDRDYIDKRREYAERGIPEYWITDPVAAAILILKLVDGSYKEQSFTGNQPLMSPGFPSLKISAAQILNAGL